ncbi:MAG: CBS domain-containing protein [Candidatus Hodarchaeales archaeon]|jgi:CBS domain-containing protein
MKKEDYIISIFRKDDCKRLIRHKLNSLPETATIREAIDALNSKWASYVCILDKDKNLVGIITERDILRYLGTASLNENSLATSIMSKNYRTIECEETIAKIALTLNETTFMHLPIYSKKKLLGIVSARDFIHYLIEYFAESVYTVLPDQPPQDSREGA